MSTGIAEADGQSIRSQADGGIVAALQLDHPDLVFRPTLRQVPDVSVEPEYWTTVDGDRTYLFVSAFGHEFDTFESALGVDHTVTDPVLIDRYADRRIYRVTLTECHVGYTDKTAMVGAHVLESSGSAEGWHVQLRFPTRDALSTFNDRCRDVDISLTVNHLRLSDDGDCVIGLTEKQQDLLTVAYEEGYFDVPRGITQDELADRLGVSKSAISQRLRRAMAELCGETLP